MCVYVSMWVCMCVVVVLPTLAHYDDIFRYYLSL